MILQQYLKEMYENIQDNWNVELSLEHFGTGKSNEGSEESKGIKRYYIKPFDTRFREIFLNFNENRTIESIVWFLNKDECLNLGQLKELFGQFNTRNIIYDDTTDLTFFPQKNKAIKSVSVTVCEWIEKRMDGTLYFKKDGQEFDFDDDYKVSSVIFQMSNN